MLKEDFYILNLEAACIYRNNYKINESDYNSVFIWNYLESRKIQQISNKNDFYYDKKLKRYITNTIINVNFKKSAKVIDDTECNYIIKNGKITEVQGKIKSTKNTEKLRKELYKNGFSININGNTYKYVRYKRSSAKARIGSCLFIREDLLEEMRNWSRLGLKFDKSENVDIASLFAYESLSLSENLKEEYIELKPRNILIIEDNYYKTIINSSITKQKDDGTIYQKDVDNYILESNGTDGQCLLDNSLCNGYSMSLLRQRFFKSCGLSTNIQLFFIENNVKEILDMFGNKRKTKDIKIIITPSSLKFLKFAYKFKNDNECYKYWLDKLEEVGNIFGVVKHEKASKFNSYNQLSYQILNTLDFTENELKELLEEEIKYINLLNTSPAAVRLHLNTNKDISLTNNFIINMINTNTDFVKTDMYKRFVRDNVLNIYKKKLKSGKIKIKDMDYCTMFSNTLEMLYSAIGKNIEPKDGNYVSTTRFKDKEELTLFRNPHICKSNIYNAINITNDEIEKYFNLNNNIIIVNSKSDIQPRLSGCDFDSDTTLVTNNKLICNSAKKCDSYKTIILDINVDKHNLTLNYNNACSIDIKIAKNYIGQIVNISQILNSYYSEFINNGIYKTEPFMKEIYDYICICSNLSMVEIDKAKKNYNIDTSKLLSKISSLDFIKKNVKKCNKTTLSNIEIDNYKNNKEVNTYTERPVQVRPIFFKFAQYDSTSLYKYRSFNCTMDNICKLVKVNRTNKIIETIKIDEILNISTISPLYSSKVDVSKVHVMEYCILKYKLNFKEKSKKYELLDIEIERLRKELLKLELSVEEIMCIIYKTFNLDNKKEENTWWTRNKTSILSIIFYTYKNSFFECIKSFSNKKIDVLLESDDGNIDIWGKTYVKQCI